MGLLVEHVSCSLTESLEVLVRSDKEQQLVFNTLFEENYCECTLMYIESSSVFFILFYLHNC